MRKALLLATVLALAFGGVAAAQPSVASVSGGYHYIVQEADPGPPAVPEEPRFVTVRATATDPARGTFSWADVGQDRMAVWGDITCLVVDGDEAWMAGRVTRSQNIPDSVGNYVGEGVFLWVWDGSPDLVHTWLADPVAGQPGASVAQMNALCHDRVTWDVPDLFEFHQYIVDGGNVAVRPSR
jgi:hypothetical protein